MSLKKILSTKPGLFAVGFLGASILWVLNATLRWRQEGIIKNRLLWPNSDAKIFTFWHGQQMMLVFFQRFCANHPDKRLFSLISAHRDGRLIARAVKFLGVNSVAGSSTRGGTKATLELHEKLNQGHDVTIAPDGPTGPIYRAKLGALKLASISGKQIYPVSCAFQNEWKIRSWDNTTIPKPFSKAVIYVGEPFSVPPSIDKDTLQKYAMQLEEKLEAQRKFVEGYAYQ